MEKLDWWFMRLNKFNESMLILVIIYMSCSAENQQSENQQWDETQLLNQYLKQNFDMSISERPHFYVIIPKFGCKGCTQRILQQLAWEVKEDEVDQFTYIVSTPNQQVLAFVDPRAKLRFDSTGNIDRINLKLFGLKIIKTEHHSIVANRYFHPDSLEKLTSFLQLDAE